MGQDDLPTQAFGSIPDLLAAHAAKRPDHPALILGDVTVSHGELGRMIDAVAAALQRDGLQPGDVVALCAMTSPAYVATLFGCFRAGVVPAPLAPSSTAAHLDLMLANAGARTLFRDRTVAAQWQPGDATVRCIALDDAPPDLAWSQWHADAGTPRPVEPQPEWPFNLIYSSGTTGVPKGIVHPWKMRWGLLPRARRNGYGEDSVSLVSTPLYSNTTLVSMIPALALGGTAVLMAKFDARKALELAARHRVTHAMMVPVQYRRVMDDPQFDTFDLSSFRMKFSTGAPFDAGLKAEVLRRWPGGLLESYGMTEGGGRCDLPAHLHPDKLHTVGRPAEGHDMRVIDEAGRELPPGSTGEVVGHSNVMMSGYHGLAEKSREAEWFDDRGRRFIRTGDIGRFDDDGFLVLVDRKKDLLISGGFNIYPSDIEAVLKQHADVSECAVVGVPSRQWGETPVGFVVPRPGTSPDSETLRAWVNERVGKTQRLSALQLIERLPRSEIGKTLKRELVDLYTTFKETT